MPLKTKEETTEQDIGHCWVDKASALAPTAVGSTIVAAYLLQLLLELQLASFAHHKLWVGDATGEARLGQLVVELLCHSAVILFTLDLLLLLLLLQLLLLALWQFSLEALIAVAQWFVGSISRIVNLEQQPKDNKITKLTQQDIRKQIEQTNK